MCYKSVHKELSGANSPFSRNNGGRKWSDKLKLAKIKNVYQH